MAVSTEKRFKSVVFDRLVFHCAPTRAIAVFKESMIGLNFRPTSDVNLFLFSKNEYLDRRQIKNSDGVEMALSEGRGNFNSFVYESLKNRHLT
ncbi:MAG: hypothetical protein ACP5D7_10970 [Limnospira sp.]